eukprot:m.141558 g.141558  ORF g.141558 m.141558 type:complete len:208 (+) comp30193_c0_seq1:206-829(+)
MASFFKAKNVKKVALIDETQQYQALLSGDDKPSHTKQVTSPQPHKIILHAVIDTDTFTSLAVKYSVSVDQIFKHNRCTRGAQIFLFKELKIPVFDQDVITNLEPPGANNDVLPSKSDKDVSSCATEQLHKKSCKSFLSDFDNRLNQLKIATAKTSSFDDDDATSIRSDTLSETSSSPLRGAYVPIVLQTTEPHGENNLDDDVDIFGL